MADFHFVFEIAKDQYKRIPAHKLLLTIASDVFRAMFNGTWLEDKEAKIVDESPSAFEEFLKFIYLGKAIVTTENVAQVMNMGKKYDIPECLNACKDFLMNTLTNENMCLAYDLAILLEETDLMSFCENKIKHNANGVFASVSFLDCNKRLLERILQSEFFSCTAAELVGAFMSWLKAASKQEHLTRELIQEHLGDLFHKMPFGLMTIEEYAVFDRTYDLFTHDEHREIVQMIALIERQPKIFSANLETLFGYSGKWNKNAIITCNRKIKNDVYKPYYIKNIETTIFSTNKNILLGTIICEDISVCRNGSYDSTPKLPTKITITEINAFTPSNKRVIVYSGEAELDGRVDTCIPLPNPILIKPRFIYEVQMELQPPVDCCTRFPLKSEVEIESGRIIKFNRSNEGAGEVMRGLIRKLEFNLI